MSNTVDNRVVEMEFDNKQFETGVRQTIASLDALKEALKFNTSATNINSLQNAINGFSLLNIENAVDSLAHRFSLMGIVGMNVISDLTNKAIRFAEKLGSISIGQIITGGKGRAQKVANARFQLEGLLKDAEKVQSAFDSASQAVDGTAYGLDAAVSTASQLAASNVSLGKDMDQALRGVAGLAAMTNSSYEEMGNIFATVASNGRLMGMQLTQISSRGINVAATLAESLHTTEAEVRDMVSKGKISFAQFSKAMNDAFGDQAQRANETLQGTLSNVRSALSRIGEIFYSGIIENKDVINFLNDVRIAINGVKKKLEPLKKPFYTLMSALSKFGHAVLKAFNFDGMESFVEKLADGMNAVSGWLFKAAGIINEINKMAGLDKATQKIEKATEVIRKIEAAEREAAQAIWYQGKYGNGQARKDALKEAGLDYQNVQDYVNALIQANFDLTKADEIYGKTAKKSADEATAATEKTTQAQEKLYSSTKPSIQAINNIKSVINSVKTAFNSFKTVLSRIGKAFKKVFSWKGLSKDVTTLVGVFGKIIDQFKITGERADKIQTIFEGLFSLFDIFRQVVITTADVLSDTAVPVLSKVFDLFLTGAAKIGATITKLNEHLKQHRTIAIFGQKVVSVFTKMTSTLAEFFRRFRELPAVQRLKDLLVDLMDNVIAKLVVLFGDAKGAVGEFFGSLDDGDTSTMDTILAGINLALNKFIDLTLKSKKNITDLYNWINKKTGKSKEGSGGSIANVTYNLQKLKKVGTDLLKARKPAEFLAALSDGLATFGVKIGDTVVKIRDSLKKLDWAKINLIGLSGALTALAASVSYFMFNGAEFTRYAKNFLETIRKTIGGFKEVLMGIKTYIVNESKAKMIKAYAIAIAVLAASLIALTFVDPKKLQNAAICLGILMAVMTTMIIVISKVERTSKDLDLFNKKLAAYALMMIGMAAAVWILATAMKNLASIKWNKNSIKSLGVLISLMVILAGASAVLSKTQMVTDYFKRGTLNILIFAAAVWVIVKALQELQSVDVSYIEDKIKVLIEVLLAVGIVARLASGMKFRSALGVLAIIGSIWLIELALKHIMENGVSMKELINHLEAFVPVLLSLLLIAGYIYLLGKAGNMAKGVVPVLLATTLTILAITYALKKLAILSMTGHLNAGINALIVIFAGMITLMFVIGQAEYEFTSAGSALLKISAGIAILALVIRGLGKLPENELTQGLQAIALVTVLSAFLILATKEAGNIDGTAFVKMAGVVGILAIVLALLSYIDNDQGQLYASAAAFGTVLLAFGAAMYLGCKMAKKVNESSRKALMLMIVAVGMIAVSLAALTKIAGTNWGTLLAAAAAMGTVMISLAACLAVLHKFVGTMSDSRIKAMSGIVDMLKYFVLAIAVIGLSLSAILYFAKSTSDIYVAALSLAGILWAVTLAISYLEDSKITPALGASLLVACTALIAIAAALSLLLIGNYDWEKMKEAAVIMLGAIVVMTVALGALAAIASTGIGAVGLLVAGAALVLVGVAMIAAASGCLLFTKALMALTKVPFDKITPYLGTLLKLALIIDVVSISLPLIGAGAILVAASLLVAALAIDTVILSLSVAIQLITTAIVAITAFVKRIDKLLKTLKSIVYNDKKFVSGLDNIAGAVVRFLLKISTAIAKGIVNFAAVIGQNALVIGHAVNLVLVALIAVIGDGITMITKMIFNKLDAFLDLLINRLPTTLNKIKKIIIIVTKFLLANMNYFTYVGAQMIISLLMGVLTALDDNLDLIIDKLILITVHAMSAIGTSIAENGALIGNALKTVILGTVLGIMNILDGLTGGALSKSEKLKMFMDSLNEEMLATQIENNRLRIEAEAKAEEDAMEAEAKKLQRMREYAEGTIFEGSEAGKYGEEAGNAWGRSFGEAFEANKPDCIKKVADLPSEAVDAMLASGNFTRYKDETGEYLVSTVTEGIGDNQAALTQEIGHMPQAAIDAAIKSGYWSLSEDGKYLVNTLRDAFTDENSKSDMDTAIDEQQGSIIDRIGSWKDKYYETFKKNGEFGMDGLTDGIKGKFKGTGNLDDTMGDLTDEVVDIPAEGWEIDSPSKLFYRYGGYIVQGLINGLGSMNTQLEDASSNLATPLNDTLTTVANAFNEDLGEFNPVITPVVDTTNIDQAAGMLNTTFDTSTSMQLAANSQMFIENSNQLKLGQQIEALRQDINRMANQDLSKIMDGVTIDVSADTTVDGTVLRKTASSYTIGQINKKQQGYIMATGGRF